MLALSRRVHALGLHFGTYSSAGFKTCQGLPASLQHEVVDAQRFASWEIDFLKYDNVRPPAPAEPISRLAGAC